MGITDELNVGHYFKLVSMIETQFGNTDWHVRRHTELSASQAAGLRTVCNRLALCAELVGR